MGWWTGTAGDGRRPGEVAVAIGAAAAVNWGGVAKWRDSQRPTGAVESVGGGAADRAAAEWR
ncbi:hypothetical protein, partial [Amycolatopsis acidiphila]|uniref:hypothetical protein n=1 Tax=Amycolatopsis acidiphila TaxID=715473 RepID=UPI001C96691B